MLLEVRFETLRVIGAVIIQVASPLNQINLPRFIRTSKPAADIRPAVRIVRQDLVRTCGRLGAVPTLASRS